MSQYEYVTDHNQDGQRPGAMAVAIINASPFGTVKDIVLDRVTGTHNHPLADGFKLSGDAGPIKNIRVIDSKATGPVSRANYFFKNASGSLIRSPGSVVRVNSNVVIED